MKAGGRRRQGTRLMRTANSKSSSCQYCRPYANAKFRPAFGCPVCGRPMVRLLGGELYGVVLHCTQHCATLMPNSAMLAAARARN